MPAPRAGNNEGRRRPMKRSVGANSDDPCRQPAAAGRSRRALRTGTRRESRLLAAVEIRGRRRGPAANRRRGSTSVNDGEFGKAMRRSMDFGAWWSYVYDRPGRFSSCARSRPKKGRGPRGPSAARSRREFAEFYAAEASAAQANTSAQQSGTSSARLYGPDMRRSP